MTNFKSLLTISILGLVIILTGCAGGTSVHNSHNNIAPLADGKARVIIYRHSNILGSVSHPMITVNGREARTCQPNGAFIVDLPAGQHVFTSGIITDDNLTLTLKAGETRYIRCIGGVFAIAKVPLKAVSAGEGQRATKDLAYQGKLDF